MGTLGEYNTESRLNDQNDTISSNSLNSVRDEDILDANTQFATE